MSEQMDFANILDKKKEQKSTDEMSLEFVNFFVEHDYTSDQIREAYYRFAGISDSMTSDAGIDDIQKKMQEMSTDGFPLNRFARFITAKKEIEMDSAPMYYGFIDKLQITENEKQVLRSIVDEERTGEIGFFIDGEANATLLIPSDHGIPKDRLIAGITAHLETFVKTVPPGQHYSFTFSEE